MYQIGFQESALKEMTEITDYIRYNLKNPVAANRLADDFRKAGNDLLQFPYANPVYRGILPTEHEYRTTIVKNYIMFYWVDERRKLVIVSHVFYAHRMYEGLL